MLLLVVLLALVVAAVAKTATTTTAAAAAAAARAQLELGIRQVGHVVDYFYAGALAPAVVVVNQSGGELSAALVELLAGDLDDKQNSKVNAGTVDTTAVTTSTSHQSKGCLCASIRGVKPEECKMARSLYDARTTRNLRDDIIAATHPRKGFEGRVVVEILCHCSADSQLLIRELVEDSPSMAAFSTTKSALQKRGLFFVIHVSGELTSELASRASVVIR